MPSFLWPFGLAFSFTAFLILVIWLIWWLIRDYLAIPEKKDVENSLLIGERGTVKSDCTPHQRGKVYVIGAYWDAVSEYGALRTGDEIIVTAIRNKILVVRKFDTTGSADTQQPESRV